MAAFILTETDTHQGSWIWGPLGGLDSQHFGHLGGIVMIAAGCFVVWLLPRQPGRGLAWFFILLCLLMLWKFYVGDIVFRMHPQLGGLKFNEAVVEWWKFHTRGLLNFLSWLLPLILLTISAILFPRYYSRRTSPA